MKRIIAIVAAFIVAAGAAVAGLDTSGLTYTTLANGHQAGGTTATNGAGPFVDVSGLKGIGKIIISDIPTTPQDGAYGVQIMTGATTSTVTTASADLVATTSTNNATLSMISVDTATLNKYVQIRWGAATTTAVHKITGVLVSY